MRRELLHERAVERDVACRLPHEPDERLGGVDLLLKAEPRAFTAGYLTVSMPLMGLRGAEMQLAVADAHMGGSPSRRLAARLTGTVRAAALLSHP